jgi:hypothetical protein
MNTRALLLTVLLCTCAAQAQQSSRELWTWTDANGVTHFSDRPVPGARRIELAVGVTPPPAEPAPDASAAAATARPAPAAAATYSSLEIWQPGADEVFFGGDAEVNVRLRLEPELAPGHRVRLYLDGARVQGPDDALEFPLGVMQRGAYSLMATVIDERGNELIRSDRRVFNVQQPTVNQPRAVGPNLRPPQPVPLPRPQPGPRSN